MWFRPAASQGRGPEGDGKDMLDLAIVGGGPGGLMSAWYLKKKLGDLCRVTIYEASDRVGGKILSRKFDCAPALYEAGVAEIYDYSMTGPDPLRELIQHFGLQTIPMDAEQVQLDGELLDDVPGMRRKYGAKTADTIEAFRKRCADMVAPIEYYDGALGYRDRGPQHQRPECAEELRDGCRRLYRPVFDPERQRATGRMPALGGRCRHPAQPSRAQGRQDRLWPLRAQHDEREGAGDAGFRPGADLPAAFLARHHALGWRRAAQVDGQARRLFRSSGALPSGFDPVRRTVLGREDPRRLVHVGSVRRLLRLQRGRPPRRRQARRAELADCRLGRAGVCQSQRPGTDRRRAEIVAGFAGQRPRSFHG